MRPNWLTVLLGTLALGAVTVAAAGSSSARAQTGQSEALGHNYEASYGHLSDEFARRFNERVLRMKDCLVPGALRSNDVAFIGIRANNLHISEDARRRINNAIARGIEEKGGFRTNSLEELGALASIVSNTASGQQSIEAAIRASKASGLIVLIRTSRPSVEKVLLETTVFGRSARDVNDCIAKIRLRVQLADLYVVPDVDRFDRDYFELEGALLQSLRNHAGIITSAKRVRFRSDFEMDGDCELKHKEHGGLLQYYFNLRHAADDNLSGNNGWPAVDITGEAGGGGEAAVPTPDTIHLAIEFRPVTTTDRILEVKIRVRKGNSLLGFRSYQTVVSKALIAGCSPESKEPEPQKSMLERIHASADANGKGIEVSTTRESFRVGLDAVKITITARETVYPACWYLGADETGFVIYPRTAEEATTPWAAGTNRVYPDDLFGARDQTYSKPTRELFGCFASPEPLPEALRGDWIKAYPGNEGGAGKARELLSYEVAAFVERMRAVEGIGNDHTWLVAVKPEAGEGAKASTEAAPEGATAN